MSVRACDNDYVVSLSHVVDQPLSFLDFLQKSGNCGLLSRRFGLIAPLFKKIKVQVRLLPSMFC